MASLNMSFMNIIGTNGRNFLMQDEKRERRSKIIDKLTTLKDRLTENRYHSPEESETDEDNPNKRKIVIRDLKWRSSSLIKKYSENKCSPPEEADENQDPPEEDDQAGEDENQEVVDKNQEVVDENQEEVEENQEDEEENQEDEEEDQNKYKRGVSVVSSEYDSISSE
ncbi:hypothetical protein RhiirA1_404150 [Rhizophagus irregularis]|uniref:Uncharacterized protein n=1 Tax=Rhizophagus irregularis TaxID=588596 RepID=A0A2N0QRJ9_9GLOM|nr:hypothetical protein RhiirA1_404150 [Rhizophagus irregularis]